MGKPRVPLDPVADLKRRLARYRGAPIAKVRSCVRGWWTDHDFDKCPASIGKRIAIAMIEQRMIEDKLAGISILQDLLGDQLRVTDLSSFAQLFEDGHLSDAVVVDWFTSKVLVTLLDRSAGRTDVAKQLGSNEQLRTQVFDAIVANKDLTGQIVDKLMANDSTRIAVVDKMLGNDNVAKQVLVRVGSSKPALELVLGVAAQDSSTREHMMTLFKGMEMASKKK